MDEARIFSIASHLCKYKVYVPISLICGTLWTGSLLLTWMLSEFPPLWLINDLYADTLKPLEYSCIDFSAQKPSANA